jgi:transcriptional regulator with XRE-family HTH domain
MNYWVQSSTHDNVDTDVLEESALAMAQATIQNAIEESGISRAELARRMHCNRSFISRMLSGSHNLTIKTMAKSMAACGFEVRFQPIRIQWNWVEAPMPAKKEVPATAATTLFIYRPVSIVVPALTDKESARVGYNC